jgi:CRISPR/Cas system-associated endonuclease/helicase Cas3
MTNKKHEDEAFAIIMDLVNEAFNLHYNDEPSPTVAPSVEELPKTPALYESIEDYTAKTGKRFRMTKNQKELGMTREEAFKLTFGEY